MTEEQFLDAVEETLDSYLDLVEPGEEDTQDMAVSILATLKRKGLKL